MKDKRGRTWGRTVDERLQSHIDDNLAKTHKGFRTEARRYIAAQASRGLQLTTMDNSVLAIRQLADRNRGKSWRDLTPDDLGRTLKSMERTRGRRGVFHYATLIKTFLKWCYDDELPRPLARALRRKQPQKVERRPITKEEFEKVVTEAEHAKVEKHALKSLAILWTLWDSGMRISEILALRRESVVPEPDGGMSLVLPSDALHLKTGPRTVYVLESAPYIEAWMRASPAHSRHSPLFPAKLDARKPMLGATVTNTINRFTRRAGIRRLNPHLFRHTRATRAAEAGWNEFEMNAYFGWIGGSNMASNYVHMNSLHLKDRVRNDFNGGAPASAAPSHRAPPQPAPLPDPATNEALIAVMRELIQELRAQRAPQPKAPPRRPRLRRSR